MFFLSYAGSDAALARALVKGLADAGIEVWWAEGQRALEVGSPFTEQLERKLRESTGFLLLVSARGVDRWVRAEVDVALDRHATEPTYPIIPLRPTGTDFRRLPSFVARFHGLSLEGDLREWGRREFQLLAEQLRHPDPRGPETTDTRCPFPGLESFGEEEARFYFGRDRELREALERLGRTEGTYRRWLAVEGPSGVGKSSFVKAGLVPAIRGGWMEGGPVRWRIAIMRPGKEPVHQLAQALVRAFEWRDEPGMLTRVEDTLHSPRGLRDLIAQKVEDGEGFLLVVDQFEEAFLLTESTPEPSPTAQLDGLLATVLESDSPFHLITTIRSDFLGRLSKLPLLARSINARSTSRYYVNPLNAEAMQAAIWGPAQRARLEWENGLPNRIIRDTEATSGGLPLMAHVLRELWERKSGRQLTHAAYEELGGVSGALTHSADTLLSTFDAEERARIRKLLLSLVKVGRGSRDIRRALSLDEAREVAGGLERGHALLSRLSGGRAPQDPPGCPARPRLLVVEAERVDLVHEALLEQWETLRRWLDEDRRSLERQDDLEAAARLWAATQSLPSEAHLQYLRSAEPASALARALLQEVNTHEQQRQRQDFARNLVDRALENHVRDDPQLSVRLIVEGHRLAPSPQTVEALFSWYIQRQRLVLRGHSGTIHVAAFSPDGQRVLAAGEGGKACLWDTSSGQFLHELLSGEPGDIVQLAAFSPEGQRVLTSSLNKTVSLWDPHSGQLVAELREKLRPFTSASFSPDGQRVLTSSRDGLARLWDATSGQPLGRFSGHSQAITSARFSTDGQRILTSSADGTACIWDVASGERLFELRGHHGPVNAAVFSPDGRQILTMGQDKTVRIWNALSGRFLFELQGHSDVVSYATFSADSRRIVTTCWWDKTTRTWDAISGATLAEFNERSSHVSSVTFSPDGERVLMARTDGTARIWEATTGLCLMEIHASSGSLHTATFSPNGRRALTAGEDGTVRIWSTAEGQLRIKTPERSTAMGSAAFSPDGRSILTVSRNNTLCTWDATTGQLLSELRGSQAHLVSATFSPDGKHLLLVSRAKTLSVCNSTSGQVLTEIPQPSNMVETAVFSPDGRYVLTGTLDKKARLWNANSGQLMAEFAHPGTVDAVAFGVDGTRFITGCSDHIARVWNPSSGRVLKEHRGHSEPVSAVAFSPDGKRLITGCRDGTVRIWESASGKSLLEIRGHTAPVQTACFHPNGRFVLTAGQDHVARIWDAASGQLLADLRGHSKPINTAAFSPDGLLVMTASEDGTVRLWEHELSASTEALFELAHSKLARALTEEERGVYLQERTVPARESSPGAATAPPLH